MTTPGDQMHHRHHTSLRWRPTPFGRRGAAQATAVATGLATVLALGLTAPAEGRPTTTRPAAQPASQPAADPRVVSDWNATAVATIVTDAAKGPSEAWVYFAFTQLAIYNAVEGITHDYRLYRWKTHAPRGASPEAAAAAAAHHLLSTYFPASQGRLDAALTASLANVPDGVSEDRGVAFGIRAADRIVALRTDDGRNGPLQFTMPAAPGVWRPTTEPPAPPVPFFAPWLSQMKPLVIKAPDQFRPGPPPALTSARYATELNEVKALGALTGSSRTAEQTRTAQFFSDIGVGGLQAALRDLLARHGFGISQAAQVMAAVDVSVSDAVVSTWDAKFHYGFWRPVTAIRLADTDGNPATDPDPTWTSFIPTPPYPDYTSGLNAFVGATSRALARVLHTQRIDLFITSVAANQTRHYRFTGRINRDAIDARVWSGLHFRTADLVGNHRAQRVATYVVRHAFQPTAS
jgi:hypothetical protein